MKKNLLFLLLLFSVLIHFSQTKTALFIGNSYTYYNNLPVLINSCANSVGDTLLHQSQTPGGAQLVQHVSNPATISAINSKNWDYMVLQEQSQKPSFGQVSVITNVYPYAKILCDTARANFDCIMPVFFMTWGRKYGDAGNCATAPWLCTYNGMDSALADSYNEMGKLNNAYVSPVGAVWHYIIDNHPGIDLYSPDNSHPSLAGSYAAACTFYTIFWQKNPSFINFNSTLNPGVATDIRNAVKLICYDSLSKWNIGRYTPTANFTKNITNNNVIFNNISSSDSSFWNFGDGNNSTLKNPSHLYSATGNYNVTLISGHCFQDTFRDTIRITTLGINHNIMTNFVKIFPNPSSGLFTITGLENFTQINIFSIEGKLVYSTTIKNNKLDLSSLNKGVYIIKNKKLDANFNIKISIK